MRALNYLLDKASQHGSTELNRIDYLDGWRGLAITSVLIHHFVTIRAFDFGRLGVDIFFVLSGMLMSRILFVKRTDLKTFYKRRISRILPVFIIYITSACLVDYLFKISNEHKNFIYLILFLRSYFPPDAHIWEGSLPIGHLWSLNVEEHSYIILSLFAAMKWSKGREYAWFLIIGVGMIVLHYIYIRFPGIASANYELKTEINASHLFLSAGYLLIRGKMAPFVRPWMPLVTFAAAVMCYERDAHWAASWALSPFLLAFSVNHLDAIPRSIKRLLSNSLLRLLGVCSYSIYLWQQPFYHLAVDSGGLFPSARIVFLAMACLTGLASFYMIENPIRRCLNNRW